MDEDGKEKPFIMGCYGVGVSRTVAAIVEQHSDDAGIAWPMSVAPAHVCVIPLAPNGDVLPVAEKIAAQLADLGFEVVIDDRKERPGVKFADADLIGWPVQVIIGQRGLDNGTIEVKLRRTGDKRDVPMATFVEMMSFARRQAKASKAGYGTFDILFDR